MKALNPHQEARRAFPKMPEEVFSLWLDERIDALGWPPQGLRWSGILRNRTLAYWANLNWKKSQVVLRPDLFDCESQRLFWKLETGIPGKGNEVTSATGNSGQRVKSIYSYMAQTGKLPNSIILIQENDRFLVADGCHRLTLLFAIQNCPQESINLSAAQTAWIGQASYG